MSVVKLDKMALRALKWTRGAASRDDDRPALKGLLAREDALIAADGMRIHAAQMPESEDLAALVGQVVETDQTFSTSGVGTAWAESAAGYPDVDVVIRQAIKESIVAEIFVNPRFLAEALTTMGHDEAYPMCRLVLHGDGNPIEVFGKVGGKPAYALIMPMHRGLGASSLTWKPTKPTEPEPQVQEAPDAKTDDQGS